MDATTRTIIGLVRAHAMHCAEQAKRHQYDEFADVFAAVALKAEELLEDVTYQARLNQPFDMARYANGLLRSVAG